MNSPDAPGRRAFLAALAATPLLSEVACAADDAPKLIPRVKDPINLEFPFATLDRFLTPRGLHYVRNHFAAPKLDAKSWRLKVEGAVGKPLELSLAQIEALPKKTLTVTLECAGNSRAFLVPRAKGVPWELGAVSTAEWTGVPLAAVLEAARVKASAVEVVLDGADRGKVDNASAPGEISFFRSLPLDKAKKPEVLLAYQMNGATLPALHGFPLRAIVGGWYGMASVKWLKRLLVVEKPFQGYWQSMDYSYWERRNGLPTLVPITRMQVRAVVARPSAGETLKATQPYRVHGAAWTGEAEVSKVEVSTDGGKNWHNAKLLGKSVPGAWRLWEVTWRPPAKGQHTILARATDSRGNVQPLQRDRDRLNYMVSHVLPVPVVVR